MSSVAGTLMQRCETAELVWIIRDLRASNLAITVDVALGLEAGQWGGKRFALAGGSWHNGHNPPNSAGSM